MMMMKITMAQLSVSRAKLGKKKLSKQQKYLNTRTGNDEKKQSQ
jgi:hypothetical protein